MSLQPNSFDEAKARYKPMRRTALRSRSSLKRGKQMKRSTKRLKVGKKVKAWEAERRRLKKRFEAAQITSCEFGFIDHECWRDNGLSFAHSRKRRDPEFDIEEVALACPQAHQILDERMSHEEMYEAVRKAILNRAVQP